MKVPLLDLRAQYQPIRAEVMAAIEAVCDEQGFILGPRVVELEQALARYVGTSHAVGVASGSDALLLALMALGVGPGDEVITVPFTFFATVGSISRLGAKPVFVDIRPETFNMDPSQIEGKVTTRTKAIIPVHLYGQCAEMEAIRGIAKRHGIRVIEDACQAIGASRNGVQAGALGDLGCFSFFPSKNLGGFGDGGLVTTNESRLSDTVAILRVHGSRVRYVHELVGINSRLDALQAAVLRVKLNYLDRWSEGRRRNAVRYEQLFKNANLLERVTLPRTDGGNRHVFNQFTIRAQKRDELRAYLKDKGVGTEVYYPVPLHLQSCYQELGYRKGAFPVSEGAAEEALSLPIYAELTDDHLSYVVKTTASFYSRH
ncbi:MAG: DegT/DnrJ/EryC1/StrS family aminotransferase [Nitrospirae bacterium]|nr:MAG: DegT/DnrJ/EryC1/StrS family aminotransferase [Nitrospirota bacterium]